MHLSHIVHILVRTGCTLIGARKCGLQVVPTVVIMLDCMTAFVELSSNTSDLHSSTLVTPALHQRLIAIHGTPAAPQSCCEVTTILISCPQLELDLTVWLADRLTMLGPRPIIASLSLGATRTFRIRSMAPEADCTAQPDSCSSGQQLEPAPLVPECQSAAICASPQGPSEGAMESCEGQGSDQGLLETGQRSQQQRQPGEQHNADRAELPQLNNMPSKLLLRQQQGSLDNSMGAAAQPTQQSCSVGGRQSVCSADVQLPHNTLVIMWPPMQEAWKHEVSHTCAIAIEPSHVALTFQPYKGQPLHLLC